jgi:hypothetical protein
MKPEHWIAVIQIVITITAMLVGPWLAVPWSMRQFHSQKWWEEKQKAYSVILSDLGHINWYLTMEQSKSVNATSR